jgi:IS30 family transposase
MATPTYYLLKPAIDQGESPPSAKKLAEQLGVHPRTIQRWRRRDGESLGIPTSGKPLSEDKLKQIEAMVEDHVSFREISATLGVDRRTISKYFPGRGWDHKTSGEMGRAVRQFRSLQ